MELLPLIYIVILIIIIAVVISFKWPTIGLVAFMSIYLVKGTLRLYFPFLSGL